MRIAKSFVLTGMAAFVTLALAAQASLFDPADITAYWAFEDAGYTTAADSIGTADAAVNDVGAAPGSFTGSAGIVSGQGWDTADDGVPFPSGSSDYLNTTDTAVRLIDDTTWTLTGWFNIDTLHDQNGGIGTQNTHFFDTDRGGGSDGYRVSMSASGDVLEFNTVRLGTGIGAVSIPVSGGWQTGVDYFFAARLDGSAMTLWLANSGSTWASRQGGAGSGFAPGVGSPPLQLGRAGGAGAFDGQRDDFAIFGRALTAEEAGEIFDAGLLGNDLSTLIDSTTTTVSQIVIEDTPAISFNTETGSTYVLEYAQPPASNTWIDAGFQLTGDGSSQVAFDPDGFSTNKAYRVIKQ